MEILDIVLSEVHLGYESLKKVDEKYVESRFVFKNKLKLDEINFQLDNEHENTGNLNNEENDDDLDPPRRKEQEDVLIIKHRLQTPLCEVGGQVWMASLLMADLVLYQASRFVDKKVLELGVGVGLDAVVLSILASKVVCTDYLPESLKLCEMNMNANKYLRRTNCNNKTHITPGVSDDGRGFDINYEHIHNDDDVCSYLLLDWSKSLETNVQEWSADDRDILKSLDFIVASDVIYSEALTADLFNTIIQLIKRSDKCCVVVLIAVERRLNFTLSDVDISCPAYNHFVELVQDLCTLPQLYSTSHKFSASKIENIPQYFSYKKSSYLEMWEIKSNRMLTRIIQAPN